MHIRFLIRRRRILSFFGYLALGEESKKDIIPKVYHPFRHGTDIIEKKSLLVDKRDFFHGWGGRIRTYECSSQSAVSYRLTTPQYLIFSNESCHRWQGTLRYGFFRTPRVLPKKSHCSRLRGSQNLTRFCAHFDEPTNAAVKVLCLTA